jgi:acetyl esterase/lipase
MKAEQVQSPGQLILLSPWLDITLANPAILEIETKDPILNKERLRRAGLIYARNARLDDHLLSPINGPLDGMGTISVFAGSDEIFVADTRRLQLLASLKEIKFNYYEYSGYSILADEDLHRFFQLFTRPSGWQKKGAG